MTLTDREGGSERGSVKEGNRVCERARGRGRETGWGGGVCWLGGRERERGGGVNERMNG